MDLNLLVAFDLLLEECSVTRAAEIMCVSQSAMSHMLNRLRDTLHDPILLRTERGMNPTDHALQMKGPIRQALLQIHQALMPDNAFNPKSSNVNFVIYVPEYFEMIFMPILLERCHQSAPNISFQLEVMSEKIPERALIDDEIDFVVGMEHYIDVPKHLNHQTFLNEELVCIVRKDNDLVEDKVSIDQYLNLQHVYPYPIASAHSQLDDWLAQRKLARKISVMSQSYISAVSIITKTDFIMTLPRRVAESLCEGFNLRVVQAPVDFPTTQFNLIWHPLYETNSAKQWLRTQIMDISQQLIEDKY